MGNDDIAALQAQVRTLAETVNALIDYLRSKERDDAPPEDNFNSGRSIGFSTSRGRVMPAEADRPEISLPPKVQLDAGTKDD